MRSDLLPLAVMVASVLTFSPMYVVFALGQAGEAPWTVLSLWRLGTGLVSFAFMVGCLRRGLFQRVLWRLLLARCRCWFTCLLPVTAMSYLFLGWSLRFIDISLAAIIIELWPLGFILLVQRFVGSTRPRASWPVFWTCAVAAAAGVYLATSAQSGQLGLGGNSHVSLAAGMLLAGMACLAGSLTSLFLVWSEPVGRSLAEAEGWRLGPAATFFGVVAVATFISQGLAAVLAFGGGLVMGEAVDRNLVLWSLLGGILVSGPGLNLLRLANVIAVSYSVNLLVFFQPLLGLGLLLAFGATEVVRADYLLAGAVLVVAANLLLNGRDLWPVAAVGRRLVISFFRLRGTTP